MSKTVKFKMKQKQKSMKASFHFNGKNSKYIKYFKMDASYKIQVIAIIV